MSAYERHRFDREEYMRQLRVSVLARSGGYCEVVRTKRIRQPDGTVHTVIERCAHDLDAYWQLAHRVKEGALVRAARKAGVDPYRTAWNELTVLASCPECNAAALVGRGIEEREIIEQAIEEASCAKISD